MFSSSFSEPELVTEKIECSNLILITIYFNVPKIKHHHKTKNNLANARSIVKQLYEESFIKNTIYVPNLQKLKRKVQKQPSYETMP